MLKTPFRRLFAMAILGVGFVFVPRPASALANCSNLPPCVTIQRYIDRCAVGPYWEYYGKYTTSNGGSQFGDCYSTEQPY